jgi:pre-mRNA-splicing factor ATP-dependent RNA helicase DHX38/PRP16
VLPVRDPTSDMAVIAKNGSNLVKEIREKKEKNKSRQRFWEVAGSKMAEVTGVTQAEAQEGAAGKAKEAGTGGRAESDDEEGRETKTFKDYMKKNVAVSDFAKSKSMAEQRRFLPVYGVRDELLQVIREHQVVVVVGQTGSGKTTQMTQYLHEDGYTKRGVVGCTQVRHINK